MMMVPALNPAILSSLISPPKMSGLTFSRVTEASLAPAFAIEEASYPADEAATEEKLAMRIREAPDFFHGAFSEDSTLVGFICGTLTTSEVLTDESMSEHEPVGKTLCIHSVAVEESLRRKGIALWMLKSYLQKVAELKTVERVLLICKEQLVCLYEAAGFNNLGPSDVVHGQDPWILMGCSLPPSESAEA